MKKYFNNVFREGIIKLKDIYSKNQKLGDAQATTQALEMNEEKLLNLTNQLRNYQDIYNEVEVNGNYNLKQSHLPQQQQQHSSSSNEYSSSSYCVFEIVWACFTGDCWHAVCCTRVCCTGIRFMVF